MKPILLTALLLATPAAAERSRTLPSRDAYADYVRARVADDLGALDVAAAGFAAASADNPGDTPLALRALRQATAAGDMDIALRTAHALDARGSLPPDGTLLLVSEAVVGKDWKRALVLADRVQTEKLFGFLAPVIRGWVAFSSRRGDPLAPLAATPGGPLAAAYAAEHRALLLIAMDRTDEGVAALNALALPPGARSARLRIAAAAALAARHKRDQATVLLTGDDPATVRARAILVAKARLPGAIEDARQGIAELFVRVAADINSEQAGALAVEFARMATLLAPGDSEPWLVTASLLGNGGDNDAALAALGHVSPDDPFIGSARDARVALLARGGRTDEALAEAQAQVAASDARAGDWARLGDLLGAKERWGEAARAYARAMALSGGDAAPADMAWPLLLQQANAELQSGDWPAARATGHRALAIAPDQPALLNFLGYSELDHGGDVAAASALIAKASALAPDDAAITDSLGWAWFVRGDLAKAIPLLERAAQAAPAETDINDHLGDAYWKAGRRTEARYAWRAALVGADTAEATPIRAKLDYGPVARP